MTVLTMGVYIIFFCFKILYFLNLIYHIVCVCVCAIGDEHSMIDHILVSEGLWDKIANVSINHAYNETCDCLYSDHWPVIVDFQLS